MFSPVFVSRNGVLIPPAQASVSISNPAIYGAYGVYESMQVHRGTIFALKDHLRRLDRSAKLLELPLPADLLTFEQWCREIVATNGAEECTLRLTVIGPEDDDPSTAYIWPQDATVFPRSYYEEGAPAITFEGQRFIPEAKSLNTLVSFLARRSARAQGAHEGLLYYDGLVTEGSTSNVFAVHDGILVTPPNYQVLSGVTRDLVIGLAERAGVRTAETPLTLASMPTWSECFITSTSRHVMPVTSIDRQLVGDGRVGPVTRRLMALFERCFNQAIGCLEK
jgi:branched-subunit amino acid aminotransferase/4-amino-4-deoxychorismate lyase